MLTKAQEKYRSFLRADCGFPFSDYLGISKPQVEYEDQGRLCRYVRRAYNLPTIEGDWCPTKKAAKESYKFNLRAYQEIGRAFSRLPAPRTAHSGQESK